MPDATDNPFDWSTGRPLFHGLPVVHRDIEVAGRTIRVAALKDAADLLDLPQFEERFIKQDIAPYGLELWPGAVMLSDYLLTASDGEGKNALELGCGLGLVAIAATLAGWRVTATDNDEDALRFARFVASLNDVDVDSYDLLDWNNPPAESKIDRILGADVLYQLIDHQPILKCVTKILAEGGDALFADPNRGVADRFPDLAHEAGFAVKVLPARANMDDGRQIDGRIFRLTRG